MRLAEAVVVVEEELARPVSSDLELSVCSDRHEWDELVESSNLGSYCHLSAWKDVVESAYGHEVLLLESRSTDGLQGVLPLAAVKSRLFGSHLTSMPYLDGGGILAASPAAEDHLLSAARRLAGLVGADLELRHLEPRETIERTDESRVTFVLDLPADADELWRLLPSGRRNRIRKARRSNVRCTWHGAERLACFHGVFARNMRDLGSPVHSLRFFEEIFRHLGGRVEIVLAHHDGELLGGAICVLLRDRMTLPWVSARRDAFHLCPNQAIYWAAMTRAVQRRCSIFDFGRSARGDGTYEAKRLWGAREEPLHWMHGGEAKAVIGGGSRAPQVWRRLPLPLANAVGPWIRGQIPA